MKLKECYETFNGNYDEAMTRIPREASIIKFLRKFKDTTDFADMLSALEGKNYEEVFAKSHNLKGMAANLSVTAFCKSITEVCEACRDGEPESDITPLVEQAKSDYEITMKAIGELED